MNNLIKELFLRGFISKITNRNKLEKQLNTNNISVYCGFDPTSDSLHLGHLIPIFCLKHFQLFGHKPIVLIGGTTAIIGDPSFKIKNRKLNNYKYKLDKCVKNITNQINYLINTKNNKLIIVNNYNWFKDIKLIDFLNNIGKYFSINNMINKECIKSRIKKKNIGISFKEFSYNLLQSYDFNILYKKYNTILQIGGSDQWGNIISGINLINKIHKKKVFGITLPLITKKDGNKFGKTEFNTIWLDKTKTSPYKFYQFWINTPDKYVYKFLKLFTFLSLNKIKEIENNKNNFSHPSFAQYILAEEITKLVHGVENFNSAKRISYNLFSGSIYNLKKNDFIHLIQDGIPKIYLKNGASLKDACIKSKLVMSNRQFKYLINSKSLYINNNLSTYVLYKFTKEDKLFNLYTIIRKGKKNFYLICWI